MSLSLRAHAVTIAVAVLVVPAQAWAQQAPSSPSFAQLAGGDGCVMQEGFSVNGCGAARGLGHMTAVAVSPDQRNVYVTGVGYQYGSLHPTGSS